MLLDREVIGQRLEELDAFLIRRLPFVPVLPGTKLVDDQKEAIIAAELRDPVVKIAEPLPERPLEIDGEFLAIGHSEDLGAQPPLPFLRTILLGCCVMDLIEMRRDGRLDQVARLVLEPFDRQFLVEDRYFGTQFVRECVADLPLEPTNQAIFRVGFTRPEQAERDGEEFQLTHRRLILDS